MPFVVKVCGLTAPEHVEVAVRAGATAIGLVLATSPRQVDPGRAAELLAAAAGVDRVAVFRRPTPGELAAIAGLPFDAVQAEAGAFVAPPGWFGLPVVHDGPTLDLDALPAGPTVGLRGAFVLDGPEAGSGRRVDVGRAAAAARGRPLVLAGGLDPDNVGDAIRAIRPHGVDASSGLESARGRKDPARIEAFVAAARAAAAEVER